jgi:lantibiotic modifying enzyme
MATPETVRVFIAKKAVGYTTTTDGRRKRIYDKPATPWQRLQKSGVLDKQHLSNVAARVDGINPADLTRQINAIQMQLLDLAKAKTEALAAARHIDLEALQPSINRLAKAK